MTMHNINQQFRELLCTTLCEDTESYLVERLMQKYPYIQLLMSVTEQDLVKIDGITPGKARQILALLRLLSLNPFHGEDLPIIHGPDDVFRLMGWLQYADREHFIVLGLSTKNQVLLQETVSIGTLNSSVVHPRECFKPLVQFSCAGTLLVHNHPSGIPEPSAEDIGITKRLVEAGELLGIHVLDHLIIGRGTFLSFKELDLI